MGISPYLRHEVIVHDVKTTETNTIALPDWGSPIDPLAVHHCPVGGSAVFDVDLVVFNDDFGMYAGYLRMIEYD